MESIVKFMKSKQPDTVVVLEHNNLPRYNAESFEWQPIVFDNNIESCSYDLALLEVNKKVTYKLSEVIINGDSKELVFNNVETIFNF